MTLGQFFAILRAAWVSIVGMTLVAALVAYAFSSSLQKAYTAKARVMLNIGNADPTQYSLVDRHGEGSYLATQIRMVGDDAVMRDVVTQLGWPTSPAVITAWEAATGGNGDITTWAAHRLAASVGAHQFQDSAIVEIFYTAESVDSAKAIVALIRTAFIANDLRLRSEAARKASAWNRTIAAQALEKLRAVEAERLAFLKANQISIDSSNGSPEMDALLTTSKASIPTTPTSSLIAASTPSMRALKARLDGLDAEIAVMSAERGPSDPGLLNVIFYRDRTRAQLARETEFAQAGSNASDAQIVANRALRDREYLEARLRVLARAPLYDQLATIDRERKLRTELYMRAAQRVKDFDTVSNAPTGMTVIGDIIADDDLIFPNTPLNTGLAAGLGLALAVAIALIDEMTRRMVRGREDLEFFSGVPVMAVIAPTARRKRSLVGRRRLSAAT